MKKRVIALLFLLITVFTLSGCGGGKSASVDPTKIPVTGEVLPYPMPKMDITSFTASDSNWNFRFTSPRHNVDLNGDSIRYEITSEGSLTLTSQVITNNNASWCHLNMFINTVDWKYLVIEVSDISANTSFTGYSENTGINVFRLSKKGLTVIDMAHLGEYFTAERVFVDGWAYLTGGVGKYITIKSIYQTNDPSGAKDNS